FGRTETDQPGPTSVHRRGPSLAASKFWNIWFAMAMVGAVNHHNSSRTLRKAFSDSQIGEAELASHGWHRPAGAAYDGGPSTGDMKPPLFVWGVCISALMR